MAWICYAHTPSKNGKPCHHVNELGINFTGLICCEKCGCTKIASDLRRIREIMDDPDTLEKEYPKYIKGVERPNIPE